MSHVVLPFTKGSLDLTCNFLLSALKILFKTSNFVLPGAKFQQLVLLLGGVAETRM